MRLRRYGYADTDVMAMTAVELGATLDAAFAIENPKAARDKRNAGPTFISVRRGKRRTRR